MQETDSQIESQNQQRSSLYRNAAQSRPRRKIYDDNYFKEVVRNFYNLIMDINKVKRSRVAITKRPPAPTQKQQPPQSQQQKRRQQQLEDKKKNELYNFKKESMFLGEKTPYAQFFGPGFQIEFPDYLQMQQMDPLKNMFYSQVVPPKRDRGQSKPIFKRNSTHIAIAYSTYLKNQGSNISHNQDPTMQARRKMQDIKKPEDEKIDSDNNMLMHQQLQQQIQIQQQQQLQQSQQLQFHLQQQHQLQGLLNSGTQLQRLNQPLTPKSEPIKIEQIGQEKDKSLNHLVQDLITIDDE